MNWKRIPVQYCHELEQGMIIDAWGFRLRICKPVKNFYNHPTAGWVRNTLRNKVWTVPVDKPEAEPQLACFDPMLGPDIRVYDPTA